MPRRPRIDMVGYYHIVNRGVEQRIVYKDKEDFAMFLNLLCSGCLLYDGWKPTKGLFSLCVLKAA